MPKICNVARLSCMAESETEPNPPQRSDSTKSNSSRFIETCRHDLRRLVAASRNACTLDYLQLVVIRQANPTFAGRYISASIKEYVAFTNVLHAIDDGQREIWKLWYYIRDLVKHYLRSMDAFADMIKT